MRVEDDERNGQPGEQARREALARLEKLRESVQVRNQDLPDEEAEALAERFTREVFVEMTGQGDRS